MEYQIIMEYQKIANLLNDELNKPSKFRTRKDVEINDDRKNAQSPNKQIRFKTAMLRSSLCDYSNANVLVKGNISVNNTAGAAAANNTNNTQIDNVEYIDIVMPIYNLIEYSGNYSKTSGSL